jgi:hypothetical protein
MSIGCALSACGASWLARYIHATESTSQHDASSFAPFTRDEIGNLKWTRPGLNKNIEKKPMPSTFSFAFVISWKIVKLPQLNQSIDLPLATAEGT